MSRPPPRPKALLLDLDGTLVDSRLDIAHACNAALAAHGLPIIEPFARIYAMVGDGARALVTRAVAEASRAKPLPEQVDAVLATFGAEYAAHACVHTVPCDGARELLACGVPCALITNKPRDITLVILDELGMRERLTEVWAGGDGPLKPAPDGVLALCARLGVAPAEVWVVGDGPQDVVAGRSAGAFTVTVPGIAERSAVLAEKPDLALASLREVAALVTSSLL